MRCLLATASYLVYTHDSGVSVFYLLENVESFLQRLGSWEEKVNYNSQQISNWSAIRKLQLEATNMQKIVTKGLSVGSPKET